MRCLLGIAAFCMSLTLGGCADFSALMNGQSKAYAQAQKSPLILSSHQAIGELIQGVRKHDLMGTPVLVATVVNVNHLKSTTPLGRTLSEMYASQLSNAGFNVKELKLRGSVYVKEGTGELLLSREIRDIAHQHKAGLVLVGTYSQAKQFTYVSLKLVRTADSRIIRSHDYALPNEIDVQRLLASSVDAN